MIKKIKENKKLLLILGAIVFGFLIMCLTSFSIHTYCLMHHDINCVCDFCSNAYYVASHYKNMNTFLILDGALFVWIFDLWFMYTEKYVAYIKKYFKKDKKDSE